MMSNRAVCLTRTGRAGRALIEEDPPMLTGTPYLMTDDATAALLTEVNALEERVELLRSQGTLSPETLARYYQRTRIEQVAESNALEGSTLSAGETELAVLKGITILGHDPAFAVPGGEELTLAGDQWLVRSGTTVRPMTTTSLGDRIARDLMSSLA